MRPEERENQRYSAGSVNPIEEEERILLSFLPDERDKDLLDVGCGIGSVSLELQNKGFSVKGVDFSDVGIEKCKESNICPCLIGLTSILLFKEMPFIFLVKFNKPINLLPKFSNFF